MFLQNLKLKMRKSQMRVFNKGMFNNYMRHCKMYLDFCRDLCWNCFPLEAEKSTLFMTYLDNGSRNANTIMNYQSSIQTVAHMLGFWVQRKEFPEVKLVIKGLAKSKPSKQKAAFPVSLEILCKIGGVIDHDDPFHVTMWCFFWLPSFWCCKNPMYARLMEWKKII